MRFPSATLGLICGLLCLAVTVDLSAQPTESEDAVRPLPIEFQPYRVQVRLTTGDSDPRSVRISQQVQSQLPALVERTIGPRWQTDWSANTDPAALPFDVEYRVVITSTVQGAAATVQAREPLWPHASPTLKVQVADVRELPYELVRTLHRLFRPQARWERVDDDSIRLRIQGAALAVPDPGLPLVNEAEVWTPWLVFRQRDGSVQQTSVVPWTLFRSESIADGRGSAIVFSGLRNPLLGRPRGRVELRAVATRAQWSTTRLELRSQSAQSRALVAHDVRLRLELDTAIDTMPETDAALLDSTPPESASANETDTPADDADAPEQEQRLLSDRRGMVTLPPIDDASFVWVTIFSGGQRLAMVPVVPGAVETLQLELPDDVLRLRVEGQLQLLQSDVVAVVAERAALILACRAAAKRLKWDEVDARLEQLQKLPTIDVFLEQITGFRVAAVAQARDLKDPLSERRILRQCDEVVAVLRKFLADDKLRLLQEEMQELRAASADLPAAP